MNETQGQLRSAAYVAEEAARQRERAQAVIASARKRQARADACNDPFAPIDVTDLAHADPAGPAARGSWGEAPAPAAAGRGDWGEAPAHASARNPGAASAPAHASARNPGAAPAPAPASAEQAGRAGGAFRQWSQKYRGSQAQAPSQLGQMRGSQAQVPSQLGQMRGSQAQAPSPSVAQSTSNAITFYSAGKTDSAFAQPMSQAGRQGASSAQRLSQMAKSSGYYDPMPDAAVRQERLMQERAPLLKKYELLKAQIAALQKDPYGDRAQIATLIEQRKTLEAQIEHVNKQLCLGDVQASSLVCAMERSKFEESDEDELLEEFTRPIELADLIWTRRRYYAIEWYIWKKAFQFTRWIFTTIWNKFFQRR